LALTFLTRLSSAPSVAGSVRTGRASCMGWLFQRHRGMPVGRTSTTTNWERAVGLPKREGSVMMPSARMPGSHFQWGLAVARRDNWVDVLFIVYVFFIWGKGASL